MTIADHEQQSSFSQTRAASVYRRLIAFNPLISAILVNGPILGASRLWVAMLPINVPRACPQNLCAVAGLIFVLLKLRNHSVAVRQREIGVQLLQSVSQARRDPKGSTSKKKKK